MGRQGTKAGRFAIPVAVTPFDRKVRALIYALFVEGAREIDASALAAREGWARSEVGTSLERLASEHRIAVGEEGAVSMAHPFSGVATSYTARIGERTWFANCAWDALAILAMLGDGEATGRDAITWKVTDGRVEPDGLIHLLVPAREFWDDIGFT
jgi:hypothetical protein